MAILAFQKPDKVVMLEANDKLPSVTLFAAFFFLRLRVML